MKNNLKIGLFGFGCVGTGLYEVLNKSKLLNASIKQIVVKDPTKKRSISDKYFSFDPNDILNDSEINVVVELIDDPEAALRIALKAFENGKHVVSANKKLIATHLDLLINESKKNKVSFIYEAAVAGSIPILRNLEEYYNNDSLSGIQAIANGTTNYILTKTSQGLTYEEALKEAQELGFAESDPTLDVDAFDPKYKLLILIKHAFGLSLKEQELFNYGIRNLKLKDINYATEKGYRIKLLASARKNGNEINAFVAPHFVKPTDFSYNVNNEFNAVLVEAAFSDTQLFSGKGAGSLPTASAVLSDISALQFDYKYEYHKAQGGEKLRFTNEFDVDVYLASTDKLSLDAFTFKKIDQQFSSDSYNYIIGKISFSELASIDFNKEKTLFFAILPKEDLAPEKNAVFSVEQNAILN